MDSKKIFILVNSLSNGGGEKAAADLANSMSSTGKSVSIILIENNIKYSVEKSVDIICSPLSKYLTGSKLSFVLNITCLLKLLLCIRGNKDCIVISHLFRSNYINAICRYLIKYQSILVTHGSIEKYKFNKSLLNKINLSLIKILYRKGDKRIFLTEGMLEAFKNRIPATNNYVVQNCIDVDKINLDANVQNKLEEEKLPKDYFIFVGRLSSVKNIPEIISVFNSLKKYNLLIVGSGEEYTYLKELAKGSQNIFFIGSKNNPYLYMKHAKALLLSSRSEGFPNVLLESLALGVPIISTDCKTGPREILTIDSDLTTDYYNNSLGVLYRYMSPSSLKSALIDFETMRFDKDKMVNRSREFDKDVIAEKYEMILNDI
ncbi:glycosyltransferase [Cobetia amphilecti]|uniref:glycosyltransferase n=1 Tax=Cobetia amphilecti TaxID=1055104 RepID=UPI00294275A3|nr:glycosyltransferase [Cobetia amphilecti]WOI24921.1 glycosyltransferase [Cobetia amphilecti]|tara:strand:- start:7895 stop:9019 length:1125 start_codon:yes stop_codon:yes gene_type:complete